MSGDESTGGGREISRRSFLKLLGAGAGTALALGTPLGSLLSGDVVEKARSMLGRVAPSRFTVSELEVVDGKPGSPSSGDIWFDRTAEVEEG